MRFCLTLCLGFALGSCIIRGTPRTFLTDFQLVSVRIVSVRDAADRDPDWTKPDRQGRLLRIEFSTNTDLTRFANAHDRAVYHEFWPCRAGKSSSHFPSIDTHVYGRLGDVASARVQAMQRDADRENIFHVYDALVAPPEIEQSYAFDLRANAEDMCVRIWGGSSNLMGDSIFMFYSNEFIVPAGTIRAAIEAGDR